MVPYTTTRWQFALEESINLKEESFSLALNVQVRWDNKNETQEPDLIKREDIFFVLISP